MRWCPKVAEYLNAWNWQPGDLTRFMFAMRCESNGNADATNRTSGTAGLFQHRPKYFYDRAAKAGVANADPYMPYDNIKTAVWLIKSGTQDWWQAWDGCWGKLGTTLRNAGAWIDG